MDRPTQQGERVSFGRWTWDFSGIEGLWNSTVWNSAESVEGGEATIDFGSITPSILVMNPEALIPKKRDRTHLRGLDGMSRVYGCLPDDERGSSNFSLRHLCQCAAYALSDRLEAIVIP